MNLRDKYPYIVKWGQLMGSYDYYVENRLTEAEADHAPANAIYKDASGIWIQAEEVKDSEIRARLGLEPLEAA